MEAAWIAVAVSVGFGLINLFVLGGGIIWKAGELKATLVKAISDTKEDMSTRVEAAKREFSDKVHALQTEMNAKVETAKKEVGEMGHSLREHINRMELWNRDNFIQNNDIADLVTAINQLKETLSARLIVIEREVTRDPPQS